MKLEGIIERTFAVDDIDALERALIAALELEDQLAPGALQLHLANAPKMYREAHRLYAIAHTEMVVELGRMLVEDSARRETVRGMLEEEKRQKTRAKTITESDVESYLWRCFPVEMAYSTRAKARLEKTVEHLKILVDAFKRRCSVLESLNGRKVTL